MKQILFSVSFFLLVGLVTTWSALLSVNHIHYFYFPPAVVHGCREIGECSFPWWDVAILLIYILGPTCFFAAIGYVSQTRRWAVKKRIGWLVFLFVLTFLLYLGMQQFTGRKVF